MPRAVVEQSDSIVITVREACGAGMHLLMASACALLLGAKQLDARRDCATLMADASGDAKFVMSVVP
jgi:hypothetical protein